MEKEISVVTNDAFLQSVKMREYEDECTMQQHAARKMRVVIKEDSPCRRHASLQGLHDALPLSASVVY